MLQPTAQDTAVTKTPTLSPVAVDEGKKPPEPPTYTYEEALEASLEYFNGDKLAANVFVGKYALQNGEGAYLEKTPRDMHRRLAREFARMEARYPNAMKEKEIFSFLADWRIVAQGSPMSGVGNPFRMQTFSNCYVVDSPQDSYGGILYTDQQLTQIMKRRGGVGVDLSSLRPRGLPTANAARTTDGLGIFMERYSNTTREVAQGGRRGALMLTTSVHHPDIYTFMRIKNELTSCKKCGHQERTKVTGANVSIRLSDEFLKAMEQGKDVELRWPIDSETPHISKWVNAKELWDEIVQHARDSAEPGLLFWDNIVRESPADIYAEEGFQTTCTNPCAELPLSVGDSCRLLLVNLTKFVKKSFTEEAFFDFDAFHEAARKAQRLMDDLVDLEIEQIEKVMAKIERDPESESIKAVERELWKRIRDACVDGRRTGLGVTGVGDTVAMLNVRYGSKESVDLIGDLYKHLAMASYTESVNLAKERGPFPVFNLAKELGHPYLERVLETLPEDVQADYKKYGRRQIANLTTAPTGSVSILTQTTGGIEPVFMARYKRGKKINPNDEQAQVDRVDSNGDKWQDFWVNHHGLQTWKEITGLSDEEFEKSPYAGAQAHEIDWELRVDIQAAAGRWVDHSISSTVNLPKDVEVEVVRSIYERAWKAGCKGITVYREGARDGVLTGLEEDLLIFQQHDAPKRPEWLPCELHRSRISDGNGGHQDWLFFVGLLEGKPFEIFGGTTENIELPKKVTDGFIVKRSFKTGGKYDFYYGDPEDPFKIKNIVKQFDNPDEGYVTRLISLSLRHGSPIQYVVEQLQRDKDADMFAFSKSIARVLKKYIPNGALSKIEKVCQECGTEGSVRYQEGCMLCTSCGASKCG